MPLNEREIAEELVKTLEKHLDSVEPLPDLNVPIGNVIGMLAAVKDAMSPEDFEKILLVIALFYNIQDENEFRNRLAKTVLDISPDSVSIKVVKGP